MAMAHDTPVFGWVCGALEAATAFRDIEARGTVRLALKKSGLDASSASPAQMQVVVKRVLPDELRRRGVDGGQQICDEIALGLVEQSFGMGPDQKESPESVFARLGGSPSGDAS